MAWVLVAWDGAVPVGAHDADRIFEALESSIGDDAAPTDAIRSYVEELLARWPDITEEAGEDSPWADGPLIDNATGPLFVFSLVADSLAESIAYCTEVAEHRGIVLYDPEQREIYSPTVIPTPLPEPHLKPRHRFFRRKG
jgi:hypothetical protein